MKGKTYGRPGHWWEGSVILTYRLMRYGVKMVSGFSWLVVLFCNGQFGTFINRSLNSLSKK
jgi:hypothetical protein